MNAVHCCCCCRESIRSKKPEYTTIPPPPSGPKPNEKALSQSGLSTRTRLYGGPGTRCTTSGLAVECILLESAPPVLPRPIGVFSHIESQNHRKYSLAFGRGLRGCFAGGGNGASSGPLSSHIFSGSAVFSWERTGMTLSSSRRVEFTH